jgi:hypothetical protein
MANEKHEAAHGTPKKAISPDFQQTLKDLDAACNGVAVLVQQQRDKIKEGMSAGDVAVVKANLDQAVIRLNGLAADPNEPNPPSPVPPSPTPAPTPEPAPTPPTP